MRNYIGRVLIVTATTLAIVLGSAAAADAAPKKPQRAKYHAIVHMQGEFCPLGRVSSIRLVVDDTAVKTIPGKGISRAGFVSALVPVKRPGQHYFAAQVWCMSAGIPVLRGATGEADVDVPVNRPLFPVYIKMEADDRIQD
ncbi:MAG: hypothetical protein AB7I38_16145 [Dehalococcoidia bacterium]